VIDIPSICLARIPTLLARADASSMESEACASVYHPVTLESDYSRVVMMTALPTDTFLSVVHMSRFILASIPVENSSINMTEGLPRAQYNSAKCLNKQMKRTYKRYGQ
jgi:hypothetical protein